MKRIKSRQQGIALLEVLLSLSIIAIILVMATRYFFIATNNDRVNIARQQVGSIIGAVHGWKNQNPTYVAGLNISRLYNEGFLERTTNLVVSGSPPEASATMYDPWGAQIVFSGTTTGGTITVQLPNNNDCVKLRNSYPEAICNGSGNFSLTIS